MPGSNLAIHDAFVLASSAAGAGSVSEMLARYSQRRVGECRNTLLLSRHLGRIRNRLPLQLPSTPLTPIATQHDFDDAVRAAGLPTRTLPDSPEFEELWQFVDAHVPVAERGFFLERQECGPVKGKGQIAGEATAGKATAGEATCSSPPPRALAVKCLNHVSIETTDVERLRSFYSTVLGLGELSRPDFGFGGAWLQLSPGVALHIIERDPLKPDYRENSRPSGGGVAKVPEKYIRRSHHTALTVEDIDAAMSTLDSHSIPYAINKVPQTRICQLFFFDPDGNGVELGNFDT
jgi:catechol 2,3-dioxygenase-like lactoylglutathione lyase family enzyme